MGAILYAISFQPIGSVLGVVTLDRQQLADAATRTALVTALLGDALPIRLGQSPQFTIPASYLAVDAIPASLPSDDVVMNPYGYQLTVSSPTAVPVAGDGTDKTLTPTTTAVPNATVGAVDASMTMTIKFTSPPGDVWVVTGTQPPVRGSAGTTTSEVVFKLGAAFSKTDTPEFLLFTNGALVQPWPFT